MNTAHVRLNFALQSLEDPLSAAMAHTSEFDSLHLVANDQHEINLVCALPDDAHENDIISVNVTHLLARNARYTAAHTVTQQDLEAGEVNLVLSKIDVLEGSNEFVMQLMLHGLHATLKDSAQFDVVITPHEKGYIEQIPTAAYAPKNHSIRHFFASCSSALLSIF
ncbi:MAG: hypothetical protein ACPG5Z_10780 [Pseudoalteromonas sp.]